MAVLGVSNMVLLGLWCSRETKGTMCWEGSYFEIPPSISLLRDLKQHLVAGIYSQLNKQSLWVGWLETSIQGGSPFRLMFKGSRMQLEVGQWVVSTIALDWGTISGIGWFL